MPRRALRFEAGACGEFREEIVQPCERHLRIDQLRKGSELSKEQFKAIATRMENKSFCGIPVTVTVQEGELSWQGATLTMSAVRYRASVVFKNGERLVQLTTSGNQAYQRAATIFDSLRCQ